MGDEDDEFLLDGLEHGFRITKPGSTLRRVCVQNHRFALDNFKAADALIRKEIDNGKKLLHHHLTSHYNQPTGAGPEHLVD